MAESFNPAPSSGGSTLGSVATDAAKLALPNTTPVLSEWRITSEGNRLEKLIGSDPSQEANWQVTRNAINLNVTTNGCSGTINGVFCYDATTTNVGYAFEDNIVVSADFSECFIATLQGSDGYIFFGYDPASNPNAATGFIIFGACALHLPRAFSRGDTVNLSLQATSF